MLRPVRPHGAIRIEPSHPAVVCHDGDRHVGLVRFVDRLGRGVTEACLDGLAKRPRRRLNLAPSA